MMELAHIYVWLSIPNGQKAQFRREVGKSDRSNQCYFQFPTDKKLNSDLPYEDAPHPEQDFQFPTDKKLNSDEGKTALQEKTLYFQFPTDKKLNSDQLLAQYPQAEIHAFNSQRTKSSIPTQKEQIFIELDRYLSIPNGQKAQFRRKKHFAAGC